MTPVESSFSIYDIFKSPLGYIYLIFCEDFLVGLTFEKPSGCSFHKDSAPGEFIKELELYFQGNDVSFGQKKKFLSGTEFERKVWALLVEIPFGETRSYKWVAEKTGSPGASRAVGRALSKNPIPVVFPCHRVIESDGSLGGFSAGTDIKVRLLEMEYYGKQNLDRK